MIGIDRTLLRVSVMIFAVAEKSGRVVGRGVEQLDRHFVVDRLIGRVGRPAAAALIELFEISETRPTNVVSGNASICTTVESPMRDAGHVGLVDLHLGLENAHVADGEQRCSVLVERAHDRRLAFLYVEARHLSGHRSEDRRLCQQALRVAKRSLRLRDSVVRRLELRLRLLRPAS